MCVCVCVCVCGGGGGLPLLIMMFKLRKPLVYWTNSGLYLKEEKTKKDMV